MLRYFRRWFIPEVKRIVTQGHYGVKDYHEVPIVINNFNRYDKLLRLIGGLESRDYRNICIGPVPTRSFCCMRTSGIFLFSKPAFTRNSGARGMSTRTRILRLTPIARTILWKSS